MQIQQLRIIIEIANTGSMLTASQNLHITQPSISKSVKLLEEKLNTKIFNRSKSGSTATKSGQQIIEKAKLVIEQMEELENISNLQTIALDSPLSISSIPSLCLSVLPPALGTFKRLYPNVKITLKENGSNSVINQVINKEVDFGLISLIKGRNYNESLIFKPLLESKIIVCVSKNSELANMKEISLKEIIKYPIAMFNENYKLNDFMHSLLTPYGVPNVLVKSENSEVLKKIISENLAIGFYNDISLKSDLHVINGDIIPIKITEYDNAHSKLGIVYKKNSDLSFVAKEFIKELESQAKVFGNLYKM